MVRTAQSPFSQHVSLIFLSTLGKRYAYKFDFAGLAAATQPQATDASYKYQSDLFMSPYHGAKLSSFMSPHHSMTSSSGEFQFSDGKIAVATERNQFFGIGSANNQFIIRQKSIAIDRSAGDNCERHCVSPDFLFSLVPFSTELRKSFSEI